MHLIERLANVNSAMDHSSASWEIIRIDAEIPDRLVSMMVPQRDYEKILILWANGGSGPTHGLNSYVIDPKKKMIEEETSS